MALNHIFKRYKIKIPKNEEKNQKNNLKKKNGNFDNIAWSKLFDKRGLNLFFSASGPLLTGAIINTLTYSAGARISSFTSNPAQATLEIAAHQVVMQTWWFLSYFSSPFSLVAQAVIPKDRIKSNTKRVKKMITLLLKLTSVVGMAVTMVNYLLIIYFPSIFSANLEIQKIMKSVLMSSSVSLLVICVSTVSDGIFIGCNMISDYLKASVLSTVAAWMYYVYAIKKKMGISGAWNGLLIFSIFRMAYYLTRYKALWTSINTNKNNDDLKLPAI